MHEIYLIQPSLDYFENMDKLSISEVIDKYGNRQISRKKDGKTENDSPHKMKLQFYNSLI